MSKKIKDEININDIEFPSNGIGLYNGNTVLVNNTVPGQKALVLMKKKHGKFEGNLIKVTKKAEYEINSDCEQFGICGGCTFRNIPYDKELDIKKNNVLKLLNKNGIDNFEFLGIDAAPNTDCYRNKMEFSFGDTSKDGDLSLGMRKRQSYYEVAYAGKCKIIHNDIRKILDYTLEYFKNTNETFYHKTKKTGSLRHLLVRKSFYTGQILINLVTTSSFNISLDKYTKNLTKLNLEGNINGIVHTVNDSVADIIHVDKMNILYGKYFFTEKLLGLNFKISMFSFFQTNSQGAEILYSAVKDFAGNIKDKVVFDLYCGTGTIAQIFSQHAKNVIGIEIVESAVKSAIENASLNNINNCKFICADVLDEVDKLSETPDIIVLDPPRAGIHPKAIGKIASFNAPKIIYISCKASSLSKDLISFINYGYKIEKIKCVDMFPRTYHVETVVLLSKLSNKHIDVDINMDKLNLTN